MPIDDGLMAKLRRSGWAGDAAKRTQEIEDVKADGYGSQMDYHTMNEDKLNQMVDESHARHRDSTGQVPDEN